jgi:hypothetical protein
MADLIAALLAARIIVSTFPDTVTSGIKLWDQVKGESVGLEVVAAVGLDVSGGIFEDVKPRLQRVQLAVEAAHLVKDVGKEAHGWSRLGGEVGVATGD